MGKGGRRSSVIVFPILIAHGLRLSTVGSGHSWYQGVCERKEKQKHCFWVGEPRHTENNGGKSKKER